MSETKKIFSVANNSDIELFTEIVGEEFVLMDDESLESYSHDYTEDLVYTPQIVLRPGNAEQISRILHHCNQRRIPVTAAGARTGLSGGMLPVHGGIILATDRLNKIIEIDERNFLVKTQPGVITQTLQESVEKEGLFYPVDPASRGSCFIGGNIAESSGGMRAAKYGITRDYVLNLEVVLANGDIINTGSNTVKNSTGFDLTRLFVGSEGILGIITNATLRLIRLPSKRILMLIPFEKGEEACEAVAAIYHAGIVPSAIEFMEAEAIVFAQEFLGESHFDVGNVEAHLLVELDGNDLDRMVSEAERISEVISQYQCGEMLFAETPDEQERLWKVRRTIGEATRANGVVKEEDTCVPRAELAKLWKFVKEKTDATSIRAFCFGHAGDGNLHVHMLKDKENSAEWEKRALPVIKEIFEYAVELGGTISGEHGIGLVQKEFLGIAIDAGAMDLMKKIKDVFDPNGILNPGKVFPATSPK